MKQATFLWKNERGIYFFRARVPKQFSAHFNSSEIKRSLKTDSYRLAVKLARLYRTEMDNELELLEQGLYAAEQRKLSGRVRAKLPDGSEQLVEGEITLPYNATTEEKNSQKAYLLGQLREEAVFNARIETIKAQAAVVQAPAEPVIKEDSLSLSDAIQQYITDREALRSWKPRTADQVKTTLRDFLEIVGDQPIKQIGRSIIADYRQKFSKLPANRNKLAQYREKSIAEILVMPNVEPMNITTVENNLGRITPFFSWCVDREYIPTNPATGITKPLPKKKSGKQDREPFTFEELQVLFHSDEYSKFSFIQMNIASSKSRIDIGRQ